MEESIPKRANYGRPFKKCKDCHEEKPIAEFPYYRYNGYRHYRVRCKSCNNLHSQRRYDSKRKNRTGRLVNDGFELKECIDCGEFKALNHFSKTSYQDPKREKKYEAYRSRCKPCQNLYSQSLPRNPTKKDYGTEILCSVCNLTKPISDFYRDPSLGYVHTNSCIVCRNLKRTRDTVERRISLRIQALNGYGNRCKCCGESNETFLTFDHVKNDGKEHRAAGKGTGYSLYKWIIENDFPDSLQILCWNCNMAKHHRGGGICPHQFMVV